MLIRMNTVYTSVSFADNDFALCILQCGDQPMA